ncbi:hypothetical protein AB9K41_06725 [Cribrihabitans sp. XS_ASV171]
MSGAVHPGCGRCGVRHRNGFWPDGAQVARVGRKDYEAEHPHLNEETKP